MKQGLIIWGIFYSLLLLAFEDLGPLKVAQKKYPQIFRPNSVNIITINNIPCYTYAGQAEKTFVGNFSETDEELYLEASLLAKNNFYNFLVKKNKNKEITISNNKVLYQFNNKKIYTCIFFVPKKNVIVSSKQSGNNTKKSINKTNSK